MEFCSFVPNQLRNEESRDKAKCYQRKALIKAQIT